MKTKITDIHKRLLDGADLVIDFATLGEYGWEAPPPPVSCRRQSAEARPMTRCSAGGPRRGRRGRGEATALQRRAARLERFAA